MSEKRYGTLDFNDQVQLSFTTATVSGVLNEDELYRISTDADCMIGFGELHDTGFAMTNGAFLGADQELYVETNESSKYMWATATSTTTSGIITANKVRL